MHAYFLRHGQTNYNQLQLCNDDPAQDVYLTNTGKQQAQAAALQLQNTPLDKIIVSQLPRTRQTADIINQFHHLPVEEHAALNDIRSGFEGLPVKDYFTAISCDPLNISVNGGESLLAHKQRVLAYLDWLRAQHCQCPLTIAHEETLRVFYAWQHAIPDSKLRTIHFRNCQLVELAI